MKNLILPLVVGASMSACQTNQKLPNVVIFLTDDQGWGDVGIHGNPLINTPTLDKLYQQSAVFNHFYACPLSATTRASLLTGRYHLRTWVSHTDGGKENMNPEETTMAKVFKEKGYQTGCFGKWHNGAYYPYTPNGQGFDEFVGFSDGLILNYFDPLLQHNEDVFVRDKGFISDIFADNAIRFIEKNKDKPFLCYVPFNAPHAPYQVPDEFFNKYDGLVADNQRNRDVLASIYAMVENVDFNISRVLNQLEALHLMENTIIIFMSDNGPTTVQRYNGNMRGQKSTVYEGGVRVPCYISWKGKIKHRVIDEPTSIVDIMPTLLSLCGVTSYQTKFPIDGIDLKELIKGHTEQLPDRMIFTHVWGGKLAPYVGSLRTRDYRLSVFQDRTELYHIQTDPGEKNNLVEQEAQRAKTLHEEYLRWFDDASKNVKLSALVPIGYDQAKTVRIQAPEGRRYGQLKYYSRIPNNSWIFDFLTPDDYMTFELDAVQAGDFEIAVEYAQPGEGNPLIVAQCGSNTIRAGLPKHLADSIPSPDRVQRWQAHERTWGKQTIGVIPIAKGQHVLKIYAENKMANDIHINTIFITRK